MYFSAPSFFSGFSVLWFFCLLPNGDLAGNPNTQRGVHRENLEKIDTSRIPACNN
jgi:hypothetical protein